MIARRRDGFLVSCRKEASCIRLLSVAPSTRMQIGALAREFDNAMPKHLRIWELGVFQPCFDEDICIETCLAGRELLCVAKRSPVAFARVRVMCCFWFWPRQDEGVPLPVDGENICFMITKVAEGSLNESNWGSEAPAFSVEYYDLTWWFPEMVNQWHGASSRVRDCWTEEMLLA